MKKLYASVLISLLALQGFAQTYYSMLDSASNYWTYIFNMVPVRLQQSALPCDYSNSNSTANALYTTVDTVIGTASYKILMKSDFNTPGSECEFGYIREDTATQQVFFRDHLQSPEILLYDFSMQVGNTIQINFMATWGFYYTSGTYQLDSIGTISINAGTRRIFYLNKPGSFTPYPLEWIESVGHPGHLVYPYSLNFSGGEMFWCNDHVARDYYSLLTCFEHNAQKVYFDSCAHSFAYNNWCFDYQDSCNFWNICGALEEDGPISEFLVGPNPSSGLLNLTIESNRDIETEVVVCDIIGKSILKRDLPLRQGVSRESLDISSLARGIYLLELRLKSGSVFRKVVKT